MIKPQLSIIIPCKNEEQYIGMLLQSIADQDIDLSHLEIIVVDADSTDKTTEIVTSFKNQFDIRIIQGGLPAVARNNGAKAANGRFLLFIDADIQLRNKKLLSMALKTIKKDTIALATSSIRSTTGIRAQILFSTSNLAQKLSKYISRPYATSMFMLWNAQTFKDLGGFDEKAMHCEDVLLSQQISNKLFEVINSSVYTSPRRFEKQGYTEFIKMFLKNMSHRYDSQYFYKDINYWH